MSRAKKARRSSSPRPPKSTFPPPPDQRAEFGVGVVVGPTEPGTVFHGRVRLKLWLDFEEALELQRLTVEAMQQNFVGDKLLEIDLEGLLEVFENK